MVAGSELEGDDENEIARSTTNQPTESPRVAVDLRMIGAEPTRTMSIGRGYLWPTFTLLSPDVGKG